MCEHKCFVSREWIDKIENSYIYIYIYRERERERERERGKWDLQHEWEFAYVSNQ